MGERKPEKLNRELLLTSFSEVNDGRKTWYNHDGLESVTADNNV